MDIRNDPENEEMDDVGSDGNDEGHNVYVYDQKSDVNELKD
jgi:hypothetical protein